MASKIIVGIDEVGRGSLAGPVFSCALMVRKPLNLNIRDSKKMSAIKREKIYNFLKNNPNVEWGIGKVSEKVIDKINIFQATKLSMQKALINLEKKIGEKPILLLIDGNFKLEIDIPQRSIIKGDEKINIIKMASIIAKVSRDRLMVRYHKKYPQYNFDKNKGYGTKYHFLALEKFRACPIHRKTFNPVKHLL